jgi:hypothetical protein
MAISQVDTPTLQFSNGTTSTGTEPTGTAQDDVLVASFLIESGSGAPVTPSGWTALAGPQSSVDSVFRGSVYYIVRGASAPALEWTWNGVDRYHELIISAWRGVSTSSPINTSATTTSGNRTTPDGPPVTPSVNNAAIITVCFHWNTADFGAPSGGWTAPTNYTRSHASALGDGSALAHRILSGGASVQEDPGEWAVSSSEDSWEVTLALTPTGSDPLPTYRSLKGILRPNAFATKFQRR